MLLFKYKKGAILMPKFKRRAKGTGSIKCLKGRRKPYLALAPSRFDKKGNQINDFIGYFETYGEADTAIQDYLKSKKKKNQFDDKTTLHDVYLLLENQKKKQGLVKSSFVAFVTSYNHLEPLKDTPFNELSVFDFQDLIDDMIEDPNVPSSFSKLSKIRSIIKQLYDIAIMNNLATVNYAKYIDLRNLSDGKIPPFPDEDIHTLFQNDYDRIAKSSLILIYTGLRISAFLELKKADNVKLEKNIIIGGSKTEAGKNRIIPIHPLIKPYIEYFYHEFPKSKYFFSRNGEKVSSDYYRKYYHRPLIKRHKLSDLNPHSFRHNFASNMRKYGVTDKAIELMMGHTDVKFTDERYVSLDIDYLTKELEKVR